MSAEVNRLFEVTMYKKIWWHVYIHGEFNLVWIDSVAVSPLRICFCDADDTGKAAPIVYPRLPLIDKSILESM